MKRGMGIGFEEVFAAELQYVDQRRRTVYGESGSGWQLADPSGATTRNNLVGLAFSGGGVRSATFNLGVAGALHHYGVFDHVDYLSTVSGGGYLGASISTAMRRLPEEEGGGKGQPPGVGEFPYAIDLQERFGDPDENRDPQMRCESPFLGWVRSNSNYMATGGFLDYARIVGVQLRGILANFLILVPILLLLAAGLYWRYDERLDAWTDAVCVAELAELAAGEQEAAAAEALAYAAQPGCLGVEACAELAAEATAEAGRARSAAERARAAVPPRSQFFTVAPVLAGMFVYMVLVFPVMIRVFQVHILGRQLGTVAEESSIQQRSSVELAFGGALVAIGVAAALEAIPIVIHYFHGLHEVGLRGLYAGIASGGSLTAVTVATWVLPKLGGLKQKLLLAAVGLLGLLIPLVIILYVTEGLIYGGWHGIQAFRSLEPGSMLNGLNPFWVAPGVLLLLLGGGGVAAAVGKWWWWGKKAWATVVGVLLGAAFGYFATGWLSTLLVWISHWIPGTPPGIVRPDVFILGLGGVILLFCWLAIDINLTSVLGLYRDRLACAYLIGLGWQKDGKEVVRDDDGKPVAGIFVEPDLNLEDLCGGTPPETPPEPEWREWADRMADWRGDPAPRPPRPDLELTEQVKPWVEWVERWRRPDMPTRWRSKAPYHLVNTSLNLQGSKDPLLRDRNSDFFMFSKHCYGSMRTGYCSTNDMKQVFPQMDLPTAMAISAAAASPNAGRMTSKPLVALMTLLNVRLGYWVPNPGVLCEWLGAKRRQAGGKPFEPSLFHLFNWQIPPWGFLREMASEVAETHRWVNLSDGGHIENLGVYELLRRRCKYIILGDAEADPNLDFGGLAKLMRLAQIDMAIRIEPVLSKTQSVANRHPSQHAAFARIVYPAMHRRVRSQEAGQCPQCGGALEELQQAGSRGSLDPGYYCPQGEPEQGFLIHLKPTLTGDEDPVVSVHRAVSPQFPHETTADQFIDEAQFHAYQNLGFHSVESLFPTVEGEKRRRISTLGDLQKWFAELDARFTERPRGIFVCYRRDDTAGRASHIHAELAKHFVGQVFFDVGDIEGAVDFREEIAKNLRKCRILLALIGPRWLEVAKQLRREKREDHTQAELQMALTMKEDTEQEMLVLPVLLDGAVMPRSEQLDEGIKDLSWKNALLLSHEDFGAGLESLVAEIRRQLSKDD